MKFNERLRLVAYAREHGIKPAARAFGCQRRTVRKWLRRWLADNCSRRSLMDRPRAPKTCPHKTSPEAERQVLRERDKAPCLGARRLKGFCGLEPSEGAIARILRQNGRTRPPRRKHQKKRDMRAVKARLAAFEQLQVDTKHLDDIPYYVEQMARNKALPRFEYTARCPRTGAVFLGFSQELSEANACVFAAAVLGHLRRLGRKPAVVQTDNGSEYSGMERRVRRDRGFTHVVRDIFKATHRFIPPGKKNHQADVESLHQSIEVEFLDLERFASREHFLAKASAWQLWFNTTRKIGYKGDRSPDNIVGGPAHSTLSNDAFPSREFDFMLSNPPYGKSWKSDLERMGGKSGIRDHRFVVSHAGDPEYSLVTRSSDGQMLFLANMLSKMKRGTPLGSRIAQVHNGSSLFTGDAGQGESNIRRWIIENDWLEAIVALPLNMFYNTGIATYIWVLANRKPPRRRGKVQLIDATQWSKPLRKNMGKKNCELAEEDIARVCDAFLAFEETAQSKIFPNEAFGYWKVVVERPLRLRGIDPARAYKPAEIKKLKEAHERAEDAPPVIRKVHKKGMPADPLAGLFEATINGKPAVVEYEPDTDLRDTEQVPLLEPGGIEAFLRREVLPHAPDAWHVPDTVKTGYEVSFTRHFYKPQPLRTLDEIRADILALEKETEGLLGEIIGGQP